MDASMLTQKLKNKTAYADLIIRQQSVANGCLPFLPPPVDGANASASIMPVLAAGRVETPCEQVARYIVSVPICSAAGSTPVVSPCDFSGIPGLTTNIDAVNPLGTGILPADGSNITSWSNLSVSGAAAVPAGANPPVFQLVSQNGLPGIVFTNTGAAPYETLVMNNAISSVNYTIFIVGTYVTNPPLTNSIISLVNQTAPGAAMEFFAISILLSQPLNSSLAFINWSDPISAATPYIFTILVTPASSSIVVGVNGNDQVNSLPPTPPPAPPTSASMALALTYKNGAFTHSGSMIINQILIYNRDLTLTEYKRVEGCLSQKWGIPVV